MISIADLAALILVSLLILCGVSFVCVLMIKGEDYIWNKILDDEEDDEDGTDS